MKSKKIGIITFHRALNAGAALQAFALKTFLSQNHEVEVVDYRSPKLEETYYYTPRTVPDWIKYIIIYIIYFPIYANKTIKKNKYVSFQKRYLVSRRKYTPENICDASNCYDIFIAGSDQIWNPKWSGNDMNFFLDFAKPEQKYSYAASFGGMKLSEFKNDILNKLASFRLISVREKDKANDLQRLLTDKNIFTSCDPVFLLSKGQWEERLKLKKSKKQYILLYIIAEGENIIDFARQLSEETGYEVIFLNNSGKKMSLGFKEIIDFGPSDFISFIYGATFVITTSFHALAFSLIFNNSFYYELNKHKDNDNNRLTNLIDFFGLHNREIKGKTPFINEMDWRSINKDIIQYSMQSSKMLCEELR